MLNGRIGGGVTEWHSICNGVGALELTARYSFQSMRGRTHGARYSFQSMRGRTPRAANHPKIVTIRALYRDP